MVEVVVEGFSVVVNASRDSSGGVVLNARVTPDARTATLDAEYNSSIQDYESRVQREGIRNAGDPPDMPGLVLRALQPSLSGELPVYDHEASVAGTDTEWEGRWRFFARSRDDNLAAAQAVVVKTDRGHVVLDF